MHGVCFRPGVGLVSRISEAVHVRLFVPTLGTAMEYMSASLNLRRKLLSFRFDGDTVAKLLDELVTGSLRYLQAVGWPTNSVYNGSGAS